MRGHIRKRGDIWYYVIDLEADPATGKRRQKSKGGFKTKKECEKAMNEMITEVESGQFFESEELTFKQYLDYWLETYAKVNVAQSTFQLYEGFAKTIIAYIGNLKIKDAKPSHIQRFYSKLLEENRQSKRQILKIHRMLHEALKHAVQWQMILTNPTDNVTAPKPDKINISVWNSDTAFKFLNEIKGTTLYIPAMIALTTGMRLGEIAALKWSDIDFSQGFISVTHNFQRSGNNYKLTKPKTDKSIRNIAMMEMTLKEQKLIKKLS
jgi:integrase